MPERPPRSAEARRKIPVADWADLDLSDTAARIARVDRPAPTGNERLVGLVDGLLPPASDPVVARWESWADTEPHAAKRQGDQAGTEPRAWCTPSIDGPPAGGWVEEAPPVSAHEVTTAAAVGWDSARPGHGDSWVHALGRIVEPAPDTPRRDA